MLKKNLTSKLYFRLIPLQLFMLVIAAVNGVVCVAGFTALLIGPMGMKGFYLANILNGVVTVAVFFIYSCLKRKSFPKNMEDLMVMPGYITDR